MKVYVVVDCCGGESYSKDAPTVLCVSADKKETQEFFDNEIDNWEDGMKNFESSITDRDDLGLTYECFDFEGDTHRIMVLVEREV